MKFIKKIPKFLKYFLAPPIPSAVKWVCLQQACLTTGFLENLAWFCSVFWCKNLFSMILSLFIFINHICIPSYCMKISWNSLSRVNYFFNFPCGSLILMLLYIIIYGQISFIVNSKVVCFSFKSGLFFLQNWSCFFFKSGLFLNLFFYFSGMLKNWRQSALPPYQVFLKKTPCALAATLSTPCIICGDIIFWNGTGCKY